MAVNLNGMELSGAAIGSAQKTAAPQPKAAGSQESAQQPQSEVSITSTAALLAKLQQTLSAQPAVDQNRVDSISKALANGTYRINPDQIASGMLHSERGLAPLPRQEI
jgi:negative regulator of flagellin synthesis FlgM